MGAYEGAGITVLGRGVRVPTNSPDLWGQPQQGGAGAGEFPNGSRYLTGSNADCTVTPGKTMYDYGTSNFYCNPSRIDGFSIINSSQGGGGIFVHGWNHNLEIANNRSQPTMERWPVASTWATARHRRRISTTAPSAARVYLLRRRFAHRSSGHTRERGIPFALNVNVHVHHNACYNNASHG